MTNKLRLEMEPHEFRVELQRRGWAVTVAGSDRPLSLHPTRQDAVTLATRLAARVRARVVTEGPNQPAA